MANFLVTYDLNGNQPSHQEMDQHLAALGPAAIRGRVLETVWYIAAPMSSLHLRNYVQQILSDNDLLLVAEVKNAAWTKILVDTAAFKATFEANEIAV